MWRKDNATLGHRSRGICAHSSHNAQTVGDHCLKNSVIRLSCRGPCYRGVAIDTIIPIARGICRGQCKAGGRNLKSCARQFYIFITAKFAFLLLFVIGEAAESAVFLVNDYLSLLIFGEFFGEINRL